MKNLVHIYIYIYVCVCIYIYIYIYKTERERERERERGGMTEKECAYGVRKAFKRQVLSDRKIFSFCLSVLIMERVVRLKHPK